MKKEKKKEFYMPVEKYWGRILQCKKKPLQAVLGLFLT